MGYHNLITHAFCGLHGKSPLKGSLAEVRAEGAELVPFSSTLENAADAAGLYQKVLRVKSLKTYEWLIAESSVYHIFVTVVASAALERCMFTFMKWQENDQSFVTGEPTAIMQMANMKHSPAARAIRHLANILTTGKIGEHQMDFAYVSEGHPPFLNGLFNCFELN